MFGVRRARVPVVSILLAAALCLSSSGISAPVASASAVALTRWCWNSTPRLTSATPNRHCRSRTAVPGRRWTGVARAPRTRWVSGSATDQVQTYGASPGGVSFTYTAEGSYTFGSAGRSSTTGIPQGWVGGKLVSISQLRVPGTDQPGGRLRMAHTIYRRPGQPARHGHRHLVHVRRAATFNQNIGSWDTSNVTDMSEHVRWRVGVQPGHRRLGHQPRDQHVGHVQSGPWHSTRTSAPGIPPTSTDMTSHVHQAGRSTRTSPAGTPATSPP